MTESVKINAQSIARASCVGPCNPFLETVEKALHVWLEYEANCCHMLWWRRRPCTYSLVWKVCLKLNKPVFRSSLSLIGQCLRAPARSLISPNRNSEMSVLQTPPLHSCRRSSRKLSQYSRAATHTCAQWRTHTHLQQLLGRKEEILYG